MDLSTSLTISALFLALLPFLTTRLGRKSDFPGSADSLAADAVHEEYVDGHL